MGSYYPSVEILYPQVGNGRLWGNDRRTKGDVGKAKLFERGTKCREKKRDRKLIVSYVDAPTVINACGLCLGVNISNA